MRILSSFIIGFLFLVFLSCKKEVKTEKIESNTFLHSYVSNKDNDCVFITSSDNGFLLVSSTGLLNSNDGKGVTISKINTFGNLEWSKDLPDTFYLPMVTDLKDGTFLINSLNYYNKIIHVNKSGDILFKGKYNNDKENVQFSAAIRGANLNYYVSHSNGGFTGGSGTNIIRKYNNDGTYLKQFEIADSNFGGKIYELNICRHENPETFYLTGLLFQYPFSWQNNPRIFVSRLEFSSDKLVNKNTVILDPQNVTIFNNYSNQILLTENNSMLVCAIQYVGTQTFSHIYKVDENMKKLWDVSFIISNNFTNIKSLSIDIDGNYLLCGFIKTDSKNLEQPFACKVSKGGVLIWSKIFAMASTGIFSSGAQLQNGSLIFGGTSNGFGKGSNLRDVFMLKTDSDGNLK